MNYEGAYWLTIAVVLLLIVIDRLLSKGTKN